MRFEQQTREPVPAPSHKGLAGLIIAVLIVVGIMIWLPAMRWFFLFSLVIGLVVAFGLKLWHQHKPVKVEDDRPLKLDI